MKSKKDVLNEFKTDLDKLESINSILFKGNNDTTVVNQFHTVVNRQLDKEKAAAGTQSKTGRYGFIY